MVSKDVKVQANIWGKKDRPVAFLVQMASQFDSQIMLEVGSKRINAKSIMGMMSLGMTDLKGMKIVAEGEDEKAAIESLEEYLTKGA